MARASDVVKRVHPVYPLASRRRGEEGEVSLLASIGPRGEVARVTVLESSGYTALDESALNAVRKWLFSPGTPEKLIVPVIFKLEQ
ncbi:MAG: energy transducer TonB [Thermovirgaceae bacterium]|nr:energy transducer TonB [Thermovirgaceae bacterium]